MDEQFTKFFNVFKKLEINIPSADALAQIPNYIKFIKEIMSKKKSLVQLGSQFIRELQYYYSEKTSREAKRS